MKIWLTLEVLFVELKRINERMSGLNSRERVFKTLNYQIPDRVPLDGWFLNSVVEELKKHFNVADDDDILEKLGIDFRYTCMLPGMNPGEYTYFKKMGLSIPIADYLVREWGADEFEDEWGVRIKISGKEDLDWRYSYHPLNDGGKISLDRLQLPDLHSPGRFDNVKRDVDRWKPAYIVCAGATMLFRKCWILIGFSEFLEALYTQTETVEKLLDILTDYVLDEIDNYVKAGVDIIQLGGDLGSEESLLINPAIWRALFKPRLKKIIDSTKKDGVYFYLHSDGNIRSIIPDLIEAGITILNPVQPECIDPEEIKETYGDKITLDGTMSVQKLFPFATIHDIETETIKRIRSCGYNGGLILGPTNAFTKDIPLENILFFYDFVKNMSLHELLNKGISDEEGYR